jgi:hypothetical protein
VKTNWEAVNAARVRDGLFASLPEHGFNGHFMFKINGLPVCVIASDGSYTTDPRFKWQHVSVSIAGSSIPPSWSVMCKVKEIFWGDDEWVVQYHPPASEYINNHAGVLHLWRPQDQRMPTPPHEAVGIKGVEPGQMSKGEMLEHYVKVNSGRQP